MTDIEIFNRAVSLARLRQNWRAVADQGGSAALTRRQCLHRARLAEAHIVDLSITAEKRAARVGA